MTGVAWFFLVATKRMAAVVVLSDDVTVQGLASVNSHWVRSNCNHKLPKRNV